MKKQTYFVISIVLLLMIINIELSLSRNYAPETVLIRIVDENNVSEKDANCFADINSNLGNIENKELTNLDSIYDVIDPEIFNYNLGEGYYLLETGFVEYKGYYEIRVVCYLKDLQGVSYTIINNTNNLCEVKKEGKVVFC